MKFLSIFTFAIVLSFTGSLIAQTSVNATVRELTISHRAHSSDVFFRLVLSDSTGAKREFNGRGQFLVPYSYCDPCRFPVTIPTNTFGQGFAFETGIGSNDPLILFTVSQSDSEPIEFRPTILRKKRDLHLTGRTSVRGTVTVRNGNGVIYQDNNVELIGSYATHFLQDSVSYSIDPRRSVNFRSIAFTLAKPEPVNH